MRKRRTLVSLLLIAVMLVGMMQVASFAASEEGAERPQTFSDMPDNWSTAALENAVANGLLVGSGGKIRPDDYLTRAQFAAVLVRAFGATAKADIKEFTDVNPNLWYAESMAKAYQMGVIVGSDGKLNPESNVTRQEVCAILARAFKLEPSDTISTAFTDANEISAWAKGHVYAVVNGGYITGNNGILNPKGLMTRAQFAQIFDNFVKQYIKTGGEYTTIANGNIMINTPNVTLKNVKVNGDLIIGDGVGDGDVTLNNVTVSGRTVVRGGGINSIKIIGNSNIQNIIIARVDGKVRIYSEDGTEIGEITVDGNDDVIIEGNVGSVTIIADDITVNANNAEIGSITIDGANSNVVAGTGSSIKKVIVNGDGANISGAGDVDAVQANADNVIVKTNNTTVTAAVGTQGVMAGNTPVPAGNSVGTGGGTVIVQTPGGGSGNNDDDDDEVPLPAIAIEFSDCIVFLGESGFIPHIVSSNPTASALTLTYESTNPAIVAINQTTGEMTGVADGETTIKVTATKSGYTTTVATFTADVWTEEEVASSELGHIEIGYAEGDNAEGVSQDLSLPLLGIFDSDISWQSNNTAIINNNGHVTRAAVDTDVTLTATLTRGAVTLTRSFTVKVIGDIALADKLAAEADRNALQLGYSAGDSASSVKNDITLRTTGANGSVITWASSDEDIILRNGSVTRPQKPATDKGITLTATITKGDTSLTKTFNVTVIAFPTDEESLAFVQPEDFSVGKWSGVCGYNVGFKLLQGDSSDVEKIEVSLYRGNTLLATNVSEDALLDLNTNQLSSPFNVTGDFAGDEYWDYGTWSGLATVIPDLAVIKVTDRENNIYTVTNTHLTGDPSIVYTLRNEEASEYVVPENFNTHKGLNYQGINVGFKLIGLDVSDLNSVEVTLYCGDTPLAKNTANDNFMELSDTFKQHSTPFMIKQGTYVEEYWTLDTHPLDIAEKPDKAVIRITDEEGFVYIVENSSLTEPNGWTWESLFETPDLVTLTAQNFNTHKSADYVGINVGWSLGATNMDYVTSIVVELEDDAGNVIARNTGVMEELDDITGGLFSTPFFVAIGSYPEDPYWNFGEWTPEEGTIPAKAVITITDIFGKEYVANNASLAAEPNKSWADLFETPDLVTLTAQNFNTHKSADYVGINVGWSLGATNMDYVTSMVVEMEDDAGNVIARNTGVMEELGDITGGLFSTPFFVAIGSYPEDPYWNFGEWTPEEGTIPAKAVITITDIYGKEYTAINANLAAEPNKSWADLFIEKDVTIRSFGSIFNHSGITGYSVGFGLTDGTMSYVDSIAINLYKDDGSGAYVLLGTIRSDKVLENYPNATNLSASFDVLGTFDYVSDDRNWAYTGWSGEISDVPDKAEVSVSFNNGTVKTAERLGVTGDASWTIAKVLNMTRKTTHDTIQAAIDAAVAGNTILVLPGTFSEEIHIEKPLKLIGSGIGRTILNAKDIDSKFIIYLGNARTYGMDLSGTVIEGFTINSPLKDIRDIGSIYLTAKGSSENKIVIRNNEFVGQYEEIGNNEQGIGILSPYSSEIGHVEVIGNEFASLKYGMYFNSLRDSLISDNTIDQTKYAGIVLAGKTGVVCSNVTICDNVLTDISWQNKDVYNNPMYDSGICLGTNTVNISIEDNDISMLNDKMEIFSAEMAAVFDQEDLEAALVDPVKTKIYIIEDFTLNETLKINRPVTLFGGEKTLTVSVVLGENNSSKHAMNIFAKDVTINDLTIDSANNAYGLQAYDDAAVTLNDVSLINSKGAGLTVNGSSVTATELTTNGNAWGGVNVDPGVGVVTPSVFTLVSGTLSETYQIWSDGANVNETATVTVNVPGDYTETIISGNFKTWSNR